MLARLQRQRLEVEQARMIARALGDSVGDDRIRTEPPTNGGDEERLRGIPVIGGTTGAVRGTIPGRSRKLDEWSGR